MSRESMGAEIFNEIFKSKKMRSKVDSYFRTDMMVQSSLLDGIVENDLCFPRTSRTILSSKIPIIQESITNTVKLYDGIEQATFIMHNDGLFNKAGSHLGSYCHWNDTVYEIPDYYKDELNYVIYDNKRLYEFQLFKTSMPYHDLDLKLDSCSELGSAIFRTHKYDYGLDKLIYNHTDKWAVI